MKNKLEDTLDKRSYYKGIITGSLIATFMTLAISGGEDCKSLSTRMSDNSLSYSNSKRGSTESISETRIVSQSPSDPKLAKP